ncbi:Zinc transporter ZIP2 [Strongyloides ratti]|uniref:Zinc transporter ZIP2 n=1 Tax=Strongyloides ratti TaxID=34506 RepID=A0A090KXF7_STRRB|nr:Zinc transporter ZIP2 [Strongyloides ratti]CEF62101.1 Zinc transporter ZIP2 [Strongyloides ratti]
MIFGLIPIKLVRSLLKHDAVSCSGHSHTTSRVPTLVITLLTCFSGGVFLGIVFLDLYPDANASLNIVRSFGKWTVNYPIIEVIVICGFFAIDFMEYLTHKLGHVHIKHHDQTMITRNPQILDIPNYQSTATTIRNTQADDCEIHSEGHSHSRHKYDHDEKKKIIKTFAFIGALIIHSSLEGFAFGVQPTNVTIISLFIGLFVHKTVVSFSVGVRLTRCHSNRPILVIILVFVFAITSPIFSVIGIIIQSSDMDKLLKNQLSTVFIGFSMGTFLYITFFEMLGPERENEDNRFSKTLASFLGFVAIAIVMIFSS